MLPLKQYTLEDFYKFYRAITPLIDKIVSENEDFEKRQFIRIEHHQLRTALKTDFQQEADLPPMPFRQFIDQMMKEMECSRFEPCDERTGVWWYDIRAYLNMREYNPGVHDSIMEEKCDTKEESPNEPNPASMYLFPIKAGEDLVYSGIQTIAQLIEKTPEELLKIKHIGKKCLDDIRKSLGWYRLHLKADEEWFNEHVYWREEYQSYWVK